MLRENALDAVMVKLNHNLSDAGELVIADTRKHFVLRAFDIQLEQINARQPDLSR